MVSAVLVSREKEKSNIDWNERRNELELLCDKFRKTDGTYDCIIPGSGGKDSAFTAHFLKYELGMNPLTVTWAPHQYTDIGWKNFKSWIDQGGFDNILFHPNGKVHKKLAKLAFQNLGHPFQPFIIGQKLTGPRASILYDIPLIFYGENQAEYGNKIEDNYKPTMDLSFFSTENFLDSTISGIPVHKIINDYDIPLKDLNKQFPLRLFLYEKLIQNNLLILYLFLKYRSLLFDQKHIETIFHQTNLNDQPIDDPCPQVYKKIYSN